MKKLILSVLVLAFIASVINVFAGTSKMLRVSGSSTPSGGFYTVVFDSTDTFQVDTTFSDTVYVDANSTLFGYYIVRDTVTNIADSANDSLIVQCNLWTIDSTGVKKRLVSTTLSADYSNDTATGQFYVGGTSWKIDSLVTFGAFWETVISDSFIDGGGAGSIDTTDVILHYYIIQR